MRRFVIGGLMLAGLMLVLVAPRVVAPSAAQTTSQASKGNVDIGDATPTPCASPVGQNADSGFARSLPTSRAGDPGFVVKLPAGKSIDPGFSPLSPSCGAWRPPATP
jgi:hypothetical protein